MKARLGIGIDAFGATNRANTAWPSAHSAKADHETLESSTAETKCNPESDTSSLTEPRDEVTRPLAGVDPGASPRVNHQKNTRNHYRTRCSVLRVLQYRYHAEHGQYGADDRKNTKTPFTQWACCSPCKRGLPEVIGRQLILNLHHFELKIPDWYYPLICPRMALASAAGSAASVIGRPTTIWLAPDAIASAGVTTRT